MLGSDQDEIVDVKAGGGVVAFVVSHGEFSNDVGATSRIIRMAADGSGQTVVAIGEMRFPQHNDVEPRRPLGLYDCGTEVSLSEVTPTGEVIYASVIRNRTGQGCGGTENTNEWTFTGVRPDGTTRLITTAKATVKLRIKRRRGRIVGTSCRCDRGWRLIQVRGDWAMIDSGSAYLGKSKPRLLDLITGAMSAPYSVGNLGPNGYSSTSFDHHGRVAVFGVKPVIRRSKKGKRLVVGAKFRMRSYPVPGSTASPVQVSGTPYAFYCGDRLFSTEQPGRALELVEYDPVTGSRIRVLGEMSGRYQWGAVGCTSSHMYVERMSGSINSTEAFAVPLT
ncbi:MAG: hypothetical protein HZB14_01045 [Actinobacteria bacterium]|nr:hypothetical protein [Actinomycetota bacterium]